VGAHLVEPGAVLADRYVVEDLLARDGESESWRAHDKVLSRSVVLQVLPSSSPYAAELLAAAKRASRVADTRILQILDAVDDGELSYVVREWAAGQSLDVVLSEGPMAARRATWLMREVAGAMANAHRMGIPHRRLAPDNIVITKSSGVKLIGLGTAAVLRGEPADTETPELEDTLDLGRLLYACLTARWPGAELSGLPIAPTEHGRLLRPRQVRAGVPRALDAVCDRILGQQSRYGEPIRTVAEVKENLARILAEEGFTTTGVGLSVTSTPSSPHPAEPPPALLPREGSGPPTGEQTAVPARGGSESSWGRTLGWGALAVPLPDGSGDENPQEAPLAVDASPDTAWTTKTYETSPRLGNQKEGVGLVFDLGSVQTVTSVDVGLLDGGTSLELRATGPEVTGSNYPTDSGTSYALVDSMTGADSDARFELDQPIETRYLLVWLTSLPPVDAAHWRGGITDILVTGG
jgi:hypothetical protein